MCLRRHRARQPGEDGQSLVEFALMVPLLFLLMVNALNFTGFITAWMTISDAARAAASYGSMASVSPGSPSAASNASITTLITNDTARLPNTVNICINKNATASATTGTCSFTIASIPPDPETPTPTVPYQTLVVDLKYTYTPYIPSFSFPGLGIYTTLPPTTIQRRAVTRIAN